MGVDSKNYNTNVILHFISLVSQIPATLQKEIQYLYVIIKERMAIICGREGRGLALGNSDLPCFQYVY